MEKLYPFIEILCTFIEGLIAMSVAVFIKKDSKKTKNVILGSVGFTALYTLLISLLNAWQSFSFLTIAVAGVFIFFVVKLLSGERILLCLNTTMLTLFFINVLDSLILYAVLMIAGRSVDISKGFIYLTGPTPTRVVFLLVDKVVQIFVFFGFGRLFAKLKLLGKRDHILTFCLSSAAFIVVMVINSLIVTDSLVKIQVAAIFSLLFIMLSLTVTMVTVSVYARLQTQRQEQALMTVANRYLEKNYRELEASQSVIRRQVHDFKNHLRTIRGLLAQQNSASEYVENLLEESLTLAGQCHSGNEVIDSIINVKALEASERQIRFEFTAVLQESLVLTSTDICAILANQIDNALEACERMDAAADRFVKVEIYQKETFVFFKVSNTAKTDPLASDGELKTTKENDDGLHGFGIRSIRETAQRYDGALKMEYKGGVFCSTVMVSNHH